MVKQLQVFGDDYPNTDGTGVRDYIHVVDLARGHVKAVEKMQVSEPGCQVYNLGAGKGYSVLEVVQAFEQACGKQIPYHIAPRREGDLAEYYADASLALAELGWQTEHDRSPWLKILGVSNHKTLKGIQIFKNADA